LCFRNLLDFRDGKHLFISLFFHSHLISMIWLKIGGVAVLNKKLHFLHLLLYVLCIIAALWQHGNPYFTLSAIILLIVAGTVSPLFREQNDLRKQLFSIFFPIAGGIWLIYRFLNCGTPADVFIVEALALAGISFFFNLHPKEKGYRLIICTILLIYGSLITRTVFLYVCIPVLLLVFPLLYSSRTAALIKYPQQFFRPVKSRYEYRYLALHAFIALILGVSIFTLIPFKTKTGAGFVSNSLFAHKTHPPKIVDWLFLRQKEESRSKTQNPENSMEEGELDSFEEESLTDIISGEEIPNSKLGNSQFYEDGETSVPGKISGVFKDNLNEMFDKIGKSWFAILGLLEGWRGILVVFLSLFACSIYFILPYLKKYISEILKKYNCRKMYSKAEENVNNDPALCLKLCYLTSRGILDLAGYPREKNLELFDYGESLQVINPELSKDVLVIFSLYSKMVYSPLPATSIESKKAFESLKGLKSIDKS